MAIFRGGASKWPFPVSRGIDCMSQWGRKSGLTVCLWPSGLHGLIAIVQELISQKKLHCDAKGIQGGCPEEGREEGAIAITHGRK